MGVLRDRVAIVSGATRAIGRATALKFAEEGARLALNDVDDERELDALAIATRGIAIPGDTGDMGVADELVGMVEGEVGPADVLVAAPDHLSTGYFDEQDPDDWWWHIDANLSATFHLLQAVLPSMRQVGSGRIVLVGFEPDLTGRPGMTAYAASKSGMIALGKCLARELAPEGILVNMVAPGHVGSPEIEVDAERVGVSADADREWGDRQTPHGRLARPEEVADVIAFLVGPGGTPFVGQVLHPTGGTPGTVPWSSDFR